MANPEARFYISATDQTAAALRSAETGLRRLGSSVTQVRGAFRALGVALSARAIARWVQDAIQVEKLTADQAAAIDAASAAMRGLHAEFQGLARTAATELAPALEHAAKWWREFLFPTNQEKAQDRIAEINDRVSELTRTLRSLETGKQTEIKILRAEQFRQEIRSLGEEMKRLQAVANEPVGTNAGEFELIDINAIKAKRQELKQLPKFDAYAIAGISEEDLRRASDLTEHMRTETERTIAAWRDAQRLFEIGAIDEQTLNRFGDSLLEPIEVAAKRIKKFKDESKGDTLEWARDLGQGLRSAFADWLVDGQFKFKEFLKRLAAEWLAAKIFKDIDKIFNKGGDDSVLGTIFGGARASGGPVAAGRAYLVGEQGPELFTPSMSGQIIPNGAGGIVQHFHVQAGLPPQWEVQLGGVSRLAAQAAHDAVMNRLGGRR